MRHKRSNILHPELQNHGDFNLLWQNKKLDKLVFRLLFSYLNFLEMRRENPTQKFVWLTPAYDNLFVFLIINPKKIKVKLTALPALAYLRICQEVKSESHSRATTCRKVENINLAGYLVTYKLQQFSVHASWIIYMITQAS